jgi:transposase
LARIQTSAAPPAAIQVADCGRAWRSGQAGRSARAWEDRDEAIRDLVRARLAAVRTLRQARQQLSGFLLRQGRHYGRPAWTLMHRRWLAGLTFEQPVHYRVERTNHGADMITPHPRPGAAQSH